MSLGYAQKLSYREDVGTVGMSELFDTPEVLDQKIGELAAMLEKCKHLVVFTGAGISTSCGIPDFRGPKGVWTLQHEGKGVPEASMPFHCAMPSTTHMALVELERVGILKFVISQNVDSLHLRSGFPRQKLAELHGNSFREICPSCGEEYIRDFEVETIGMKETSRRCSKLNCGAKLRDTVLDWEDALPRKEMNAAEKQCKIADVVLCLGTSLQITPACNLPLKTIRGGGKIVIVNLQPTPKDKKASLVIHGLVDKVISGAVQILNLRIPPYVRIDHIQLHLSYLKKKEANVKWTLKISGMHGPKSPLPFLKSIEVSFLERPDLKTVILQKQPFCLIRQTKRTMPLKMALKLNFTEGCGCQFAQIELPINFQLSAEGFSHDKGLLFQKLKATAVENVSSGHSAIVEKKVSLGNETSVHAIVTNICLYDHATSKACETYVYENRDKGQSDTKELIMPPLLFDYRGDVGKIKEDMTCDQMIKKGISKTSKEEMGRGKSLTEVGGTNNFGDDKESTCNGQRSPKKASSTSKGKMTQRSGDKDTDCAETPLKRCKILVSTDCGQ